MRVVARANTMQALVKYHGLRDWGLRIPFHDSVSVNTTSLYSETSVSTNSDKGLLSVNGIENRDAALRAAQVLAKISGKTLDELKLAIESVNRPVLNAKGLGFSSSGGAALTLACYRAIMRRKPDHKSLSRLARLFAASASRSVVGGFARLYVGRSDEDTFAEKIGDSKELDLRMVIVPLPSRVKTEEAHKEAESSPFFKARLESAQKRCDAMERAIRSGDFRRVGELTEQDSLELHSITMTGASRLVIFSEDSIRVVRKVKELRSNGTDAYFSMQTGPSVFINTTENHMGRVRAAISRLGYRTILSGVGEGARLIGDSA